MKRVIGILLDHGSWKGIPIRRTGHEKISFYNKAGKKLHLVPFYVSLPQINLKNKTVLGYRPLGGTYRLVRRAIPKVIHNRSMSMRPSMQKKLRLLSRLSFVYNQRTRYSKYQIHRLLAKKKSLQPYLPQTKLFSKASLKRMMKQHPALYVKPVSSSIGRGIMKVFKNNKKQWQVQVGKKRKKMKKKHLYHYLRKKIAGKTYLVQEAISLAKYKGKPFDIRVSVQKGGQGEWKVTGMVGKVAAKGSHVTNVARGGKVKRCESLWKACGLDRKHTKKRIKKVSLKIAKQLEKKLPHLADIGLDIGIDSQGHPYFIEMNGRDLRYSFREGKLMKKWYKTYENPLRYGKFMLSKRI